MTASLKIRQLESKISGLQTQHQLLLKERAQEIAGLLSVVALAHLDDKTLLGGLCKALHNPPYAKKVIMQSIL